MISQEVQFPVIHTAGVAGSNPAPPTKWRRDGTTHLVMSPLEFVRRLATLVPRPRLHLMRFHGVLALDAKLRTLMVPQRPEPPAQATARRVRGELCAAQAGCG